MKRYCGLIIISLFSHLAISQRIDLPICQKDSINKKMFMPNLAFGYYSIDSFEDTIYTKHSNSSIIFEDKEFVKFPTNNHIDSVYYHESEDGAVYWLDEKEKKIKEYIPKDEIEGYETVDFYGHSLLFLGYHVHVETPVCTYHDAIMVIEKPYKDANINICETIYFVRGIGFIAREYRDIIKLYLVKRFIEK